MNLKPNFEKRRGWAKAIRLSLLGSTPAQTTRERACRPLNEIIYYLSGMANLPNVAIEAANLLARMKQPEPNRRMADHYANLQGRIEVPQDMAWYMSNHPMCASGIPVTDLGHVDNIITEDIDCEIVDPKALPPPQS